VTCGYVDADLTPCFAEAVWDTNVHGPGHLPRCARHKRSSPAAVANHLRQYRFKRARARGLVSQAEMLAFVDEWAERRFRDWWWDYGKNAGGNLSYWAQAGAIDHGFIIDF
jgi:hypothetical protein